MKVKGDTSLDIFLHYFFHRNLPVAFGVGGGVGVWYLTPLSTIFHLYHGGQFY
jgi:hypothetical protein